MHLENRIVLSQQETSKGAVQKLRRDSYQQLF